MKQKTIKCGAYLVLFALTFSWVFMSNTAGHQYDLLPDFTAEPTIGKAPLMVEFKDASLGEPTEWYWDVDDDGDYLPVNNSSVQFTYDSIGKYSVKLKICNSTECDSLTKFEFINVIPFELEVEEYLYVGNSCDFQLKLSRFTNEIEWVSFQIMNPSPDLTHSWLSIDKFFYTGDIVDFTLTITSVDDIQPDDYQIIIYCKSGPLDFELFKTIEVTTDVRYFFPNPFTPNNDGYNDVVEYDREIVNYSLEIFNLTGKKIRKTNDRFWDGKDNSGNLVQVGVYIYLVKSNGEVVEKGSITLAL